MAVLVAEPAAEDAEPATAEVAEPAATLDSKPAAEDAAVGKGTFGVWVPSEAGCWGAPNPMRRHDSNKDLVAMVKV